MSLSLRVLSLCFVALTACGGADHTNSVQYDGDTLVVDGVRYPRSTIVTKCGAAVVCGNGQYAAGEVIAVPNDLAAALSLAPRYSLGIVSAHAQMVVFGVPELFEEQWAAALRGRAELRGADVNSLMTISNATAL